MRLVDIRGEAEETIMLVEVADSSIHWMEPKDLSPDEVTGSVNRESTLGVLRGHTEDPGHWYREIRVAAVLLANGAVRLLPEDVPPDTLKALLTANGGEAVPPDAFDVKRVDWTRCLAVLAFAICLILLVARRRRPDGNRP
jgi:hypothetical protein